MSLKVTLSSERAETKKSSTSTLFQGVMSDVTEQAGSMCIAPKAMIYEPGEFRSTAPCGLHHCHDSRP